MYQKNQHFKLHSSRLVFQHSKSPEKPDFSSDNLDKISSTVEQSVRDRLSLNKELMPTLELIKTEKEQYKQLRNQLIEQMEINGEDRQEGVFNCLGTEVTVRVYRENGEYLDSAVIGGQEVDFTQWVLSKKS
ncbi:MAG: hypothetical protein ACRCZE_04970 [Candidatus Altimarinota bacterium]